MRSRRRGLGRKLVVAGALSALFAATAAYATIRATNGSNNGNVSGARAVGAFSAPVQSGTLQAGTAVQPATYDSAPRPTAEQRKALLERDLRQAPAPNRNTVNAPNPGPPMKPPAVSSGLSAAPTPKADSDYVRFGVSGPPWNKIFSSYINEPSIAQAGNVLLSTGNWWAGFSATGGKKWKFYNPFVMFGPGFCCDQVAIYDRTHNMFIWLLQYDTHLTIARAFGSKKGVGSWCFWNFNGASIGRSGYDLDFNDAMVGTENYYFTTNIFGGADAGSGVVRIPLEQLAACGGLSFQYYSQLNDAFTWRLAQGSHDRAYWGSDWDMSGGFTNGQYFRLFYWDENSGTIHWNNYGVGTVDPFAFYVRNSGQDCSSEDLAVTNWCQFADSRVLGAAVGDGIIHFSMNAKQGGGFTFPYTVREYFNESDLSYIGHSNLYSDDVAYQFMSLATNSQGHVGGSWLWGGGTGGTHYFPGSGVTLDDDITPNQPWTYDYVQYGGGNTCYTGGLYRSGDYLTTRANNAADTTFVSTLFAPLVSGGSCGFNGPVQSLIVNFGRMRDTNNVARWGH